MIKNNTFIVIIIGMLFAIIVLDSPSYFVYTPKHIVALIYKDKIMKDGSKIDYNKEFSKMVRINNMFDDGGG